MIDLASLSSMLLMVDIIDSNMPQHISAADWCKGIGLSLAASIIAGASKLAIRKSWLLQAELLEAEERETDNESTNDNHNLNNSTDTDSESLLPSISDDLSSTLSTSSTSSTSSHSSLLIPTRTSNEDDPSPYSFLLRCHDKKRFPHALRYSGMFGMTILNPICSVFAMNYASPSILAPLGGLTLVWVILFSSVTVGEQPTQSEILAAMLIMFGEVIVAVFGDHTNDYGMTVHDVKQSYTSPATISYFVGLTAYMLLLWYWIAFSKNPSLQRFAWGSCGGAITGPQSFLKDALIVVKAVASSTTTTTTVVAVSSWLWLLILLIVLAIITSFTGLLLLTACMKRFDATYSAAAFVGSFVVSASINAACHFHTFSSLPSTWNDVLYPMGIVILIFGVFLLESMGKHPQQSNILTMDDPYTTNEQDNDDDDENTRLVHSNMDAHRDGKDSEDDLQATALAFGYTQVQDNEAGVPQ